MSARPFTGMPLDRASTVRKDPARVAALLEDPGAQVLAANDEGVFMDDGQLVRGQLTEAVRAEPILLGLDDGRALFALDYEALATDQPGQIVSLREAGVTLPPEEAGLAAYLVALLNWHRHHRHCANCGAPTTVEEAGYSRHCPVCGAQHFPRTDPVVIMAISHRDRLLLGRRAASPPNRYSVLAGFVSPGESAEEAVIREVQEESGIRAHDPRYVTSQPWPFPASLMLGFQAEADGGEPRPGDGELERVRWVPLDDVREAVNDRHEQLLLPPKLSIARFLIERWVASR